MKRINILIVDDHEVVRTGMQTILEKYALTALVHQARSASEALKIFDTQDIDILITDIKMPKMSGVELAQKVKEDKPDTEIIALTFLEQHQYIRQLLDIGVKYILLKSEEGGIQQVFQAMRNDREYFSPEILRIVTEMRDEVPEQTGPSLTPRETELLKHLANDFSTKQAAEKMNVAGSTAESYRKSLRNKFKANSIQGVVAKAYEYGILK